MLEAAVDSGDLKPRKDTAASYDPSEDALAPYRNDAYGAESDATTGATYDVGDNPFRYAGELRDPVSGAYYLRARWYLPEVPSFVARDPLAHLNRYGYAAGNPVMNVDPSGMRSRSIFDDLSEGIEWLDSGVQGHLARLFLAPAMGAFEIIAHTLESVFIRVHLGLFSLA
jgi:RHS repeat-associated protein